MKVKKILLLMSLMLLCFSCFIHTGNRMDGQCRPKKPNFKLNKAFSNGTDKLVFNKIYVVDSELKPFGFGFYPDGRLIYVYSKDGFPLKIEDVITKNWDNAPAIGYWSIDGDKIKTEYFSCSNSGNYIRNQGEIKGDTLFFERDCGSNPFKSYKCYDKYILSDMVFR